MCIIPCSVGKCVLFLSFHLSCYASINYIPTHYDYAFIHCIVVVLCVACETSHKIDDPPGSFAACRTRV